MKIEVVKDTNKRMCAVCKKRIAKGSIIAKYECVIDGWKNTRMWFAHISCLIQKLNTVHKNIKKELNKIPKIESYIERCIK